MLYFLIPAGIFLALLLLYILSLRPRLSQRERLEPYKGRFIAHRGFFNNTDTPENSMAAFRRAKESGYGIELDVQITADGKLCVFHDKTLKRMCGVKRTLTKLTYKELLEYPLLETGERIPLFKDVLEMIDGAVPLVVEIKANGEYIRTARLTDKLLRDYEGDFCIESFHPMVLRWFKKHSPRIIRGQLSTNHVKDNKKEPLIGRFILTNLLTNFIAAPDFIAYNKIYKDQFSLRLCKKLYKPATAAWTVRSKEELEEAREHFDFFIFDSFEPDCKAENKRS